MPPKVALVYDRVNTPHGGAEQVLLALHQAFPHAPLYTSVYHSRAKWARVFTIKTSFLQKVPLAKHLHRYFVGLMPLAFESLDLSEYDIIISVTSAEAKGILTKPHQLHACYLMTPTRYLYSHRGHYQQTHWPFKLPIIRFFSRLIFDYLAWWDQVAAFRPDVIIPISNLVAQRVEKYYHRQTAPVIYPPLNLSPLQASSAVVQYQPYYLPEEYLLAISRLVPYKQIDLAIQACQQLKQNLVIIGEGPQLASLKKIAGDNVYFLGSVTSTQRQAILSQAKALLMPGIEDFGIAALEAVLAKVPIILHSKTGAAELLFDKNGRKTAIYLEKLSLTALKKAIQQLDYTRFDFTSIEKKLADYAITDFIKRFQATVFKFQQRQQKGNL